ncbi:MAG: aspartate kinase [Acidobacteriia bacterium]|nr:aspartate kinase [Terriglobia bacterium]
MNHPANRQHLIVMKFGGTSVGSAERISQCAAIIGEAAKNHRIIVVVSAVAGVTDLIFKTIEATRKGDAVATEVNLRKFESLHQTLIADLFGGLQSGAAFDFLGQIFSQLRNACMALLTLRTDISPQTQDSLVSLGERMSGWLLAHYMAQTETASEFVRAEDAIITDSNFGNASPDMEATAVCCRNTLLPITARGKVAVVAGYSGASHEGKTTTLGRGGSDYSATIIGAAAGADEVWIWTDVDGVLTADPRLCPNATVLPEITFAEAIELAYYGAKVIHPKAAYPALQAGFPLWIKNSFRPEVPGTKITLAALRTESPVKAVTCVTNAALIMLVTRGDFHPAELFGRLFLRLGQERIDMLFATQSSPEHALGLVVRKEDSDRVMKLIQTTFRMELAQGVLNPVVVQDDVAVVAVLGEGMKGTCGILAQLFAAVARSNVSVIAVAQGASELSVCFAVPSATCAQVVQRVHEEFWGPRTVEALNGSMAKPLSLGVQ